MVYRCRRFIKCDGKNVSYQVFKKSSSCVVDVLFDTHLFVFCYFFRTRCPSVFSFYPLFATFRDTWEVDISGVGTTGNEEVREFLKCSDTSLSILIQPAYICLWFMYPLYCCALIPFNKMCINSSMWGSYLGGCPLCPGLLGFKRGCIAFPMDGKYMESLCPSSLGENTVDLMWPEGAKKILKKNWGNYMEIVLECNFVNWKYYNYLPFCIEEGIECDISLMRLVEEALEGGVQTPFEWMFSIDALGLSSWRPSQQPVICLRCAG